MELVAIHNNLTGFILAVVIGIALCALGRNYERKYIATSALAVLGMVVVYYAAMIGNASKMGHMVAGLFALGTNIVNTVALNEKRKDIFYVSIFVVILIAINAMLGFALS
ncbi:MAG: hypothetical protein IB616_05615 [Methanosarcinales archaeon]|nr:MAG: hypothetical protein IB616_05615 [Methanosarcinales archaeon]